MLPPRGTDLTETLGTEYSTLPSPPLPFPSLEVGSLWGVGQSPAEIEFSTF